MTGDQLCAIAIQCERLKAVGCARGCQNCQYNVFNYVDDVREASLLQANAASIVTNQQEILRKANQAETASMMGPLLAIIVMIVLGMFACHACANPGQTILQMEMNGKQSGLMPEAEIRWLKAHPNNPQNIPRIIRCLKQGVYDVNKDGRVNCIDYSILFRMLYGSNARLYINRNPWKDMNHMFICVHHNGTVMYVEPQGEPDRYMMGLIWGVRFDINYNTDVTSTWGEYLE